MDRLPSEILAAVAKVWTNRTLEDDLYAIWALEFESGSCSWERQPVGVKQHYCEDLLERRQERVRIAKRALGNMRLVNKRWRESVDSELKWIDATKIPMDGLLKFCSSRQFCEVVIIDLQHNLEVTNDGLRALRFLTKLTTINLDRCDVSDACIEALGSRTTLEFVSVSDTKVTDTGIGVLSSLPRIINLNLSWCENVTDVGMKSLTSLKALTSLNVCGCEVTDAWMGYIRGMTKITSLNLGGSEVTDSGIRAMCDDMTNITSLNLAECDEVTDSGIRHICNLKNLTYLNLSYCEGVTDAGISELCNLQALTSLDLSNCQRFTNSPQLQKLQALTSLDFESCTEVTDEAIEAISDLPALTFLNLFYCRSVTDAGIRKLGTKLTSLTFLDLSWCYQVSDFGLQFISILGLRSLKYLGLSHNKKVTDSGIMTLLKGLPALTYLDIRFCERVTPGIKGPSKLAIIGPESIDPCLELRISSLCGSSSVDSLDSSSLDSSSVEY